MTPQVMIKSDGFMRGDAMRNAMSGGTGIPAAMSPPVRGIAAKVHMGEKTPRTAETKIGIPPLRVRNILTFPYVMR